MTGTVEVRQPTSHSLSDFMASPFIRRLVTLAPKDVRVMPAGAHGRRQTGRGNCARLPGACWQFRGTRGGDCQ
jgi:hypothetical protein